MTLKEVQEVAKLVNVPYSRKKKDDLLNEIVIPVRVVQLKEGNDACFMTDLLCGEKGCAWYRVCQR